MKHIESRTQIICKRWFDLQHPKLAPLLFAVPNGGKRGVYEARILRLEGVVAGVADMILLLPRGGYATLCIEFKTETGRQSPAQRAWQQAAQQAGSKYVVVRTLPQFIAAVSQYLAAVDVSKTETTAAATHSS